jgi:superfamily II DNA or RNA helicase
MVLTEGWDQPDVSCCILARPTKSLGLYRQMVGRVLRPSPGKDHALILDHAGAVFQHGFAEDPIEWQLDDTFRLRVRAHEQRQLSPSNRLIECSQCQAVRQGGKPCPNCGFMPKRPAEYVHHRDGDLARLDRDGSRQNEYTVAVMQSWHRQLTGIAEQRGYKPGWIGHKYKEKFGRWPTQYYVQAEEPSSEVLAWVRSRAIAWAKGQERYYA